VRSGRGGFHRSRPREIEQVCQGGALLKEKPPSTEGREREGEFLPGASEFADGNGGSVSSVLRSLVAKSRGESGGSRE
jgi:hypothetical protein